MTFGEMKLLRISIGRGEPGSTRDDSGVSRSAGSQAARRGPARDGDGGTREGHLPAGAGNVGAVVLTAVLAMGATLQLLGITR